MLKIRKSTKGFRKTVCGTWLPPDTYVNMYEEPELIKAMLDRYCKASYEIYERMYEATNNKVEFDETTRVIKALYQDGQAGGYILCGSQDFEGDVPPENVCALYEAGKQYK